MFIPLAVLIGLAVIIVGFYERELSQAVVLTEIERVGAVKDLELVLSDEKSGLRSVRIELIQGARKEVVFEKDYPRQGVFYNSGPAKAEETVRLEPAALKFKMVRPNSSSPSGIIPGGTGCRATLSNCLSP